VQILDKRDKKLFAGIIIALIIAVIALVLLLPHHRTPSTAKTIPQYNSSNYTNFNSISGYKPINKSVSSSTSTTTTVSQSNLTSNTTVSSQSYANSTTTTVDYTYCIGSGTYPYNQSYYTAFEPQIDFYGPTSGRWTATQSYPISVIGPSCTISNGYIYCVGGYSNGTSTSSAFFANVTINGIGNWTSTTNYPVPFSKAGCSSYNGYIYCVSDSNSLYANATYYAKLSPNGIGPWKATSPYPNNISGPSCTIYNGYIYCVGGLNTTSAYSAYLPVSPISYYATVSQSGIGPWTKTTAYPLNLYNDSCNSYLGYIYCIGGSDSFAALMSINYTSALGVTPGMSESQVESIAKQSLYGIINQTESLDSNRTAVYYAPISKTGIGKWNLTYPYPAQLSSSDCVTTSGPFLYCIGSSTSGYTNGVYFTQLISNGTYSNGYGPQPSYNITVNDTNGQIINETYVPANYLSNTIISVPPGSLINWQQSYSYPIPFYYGSCASSSSTGGYYS
jgi:hypothetical protein